MITVPFCDVKLDINILQVETLFNDLQHMSSFDYLFHLGQLKSL